MRLVSAGLCAGIAILLASCGALPPQHTPPRRNSMQDYALLAGIGDVPRTNVVKVNGQPLETAGHLPDDAPPMSSKTGVWLRPGRHVVFAQFVRNIEGGIAFVQGDLVGNLNAGHTYMVHPVYGSDRDQVRFALVDYGRSFPHRCLPASIGAAKDPAGRSKNAKFTTDEIHACAQWVASKG